MIDILLNGLFVAYNIAIGSWLVVMAYKEIKELK